MGAFEIPAFDWTGSEYVVSFEAGLLEDSCQAVYFARAAGETRRGRAPGGISQPSTRAHRAKLVHVGPTFDLSAHNADEWIQINPGTSGAFALGLCHILARDDKFHKEAVATGTEDFEAFKTALAEFTPQRVQALTGAAAEAVVRIAHELEEDIHTAFAFLDERSVAFSNGLATAHAVLDLNAMLGATQRTSGGVLIEPTPPYASCRRSSPTPSRTRGSSSRGSTGPARRSIRWRGPSTRRCRTRSTAIPRRSCCSTTQTRCTRGRSRHGGRTRSRRCRSS